MKKPTKLYINKTYKEKKGEFFDKKSYLNIVLWNDGDVSLRTFHKPRSKAYVVLNRRNVMNLIKALKKSVKGWKCQNG